jgi:hypothetical protein
MEKYKNLSNDSGIKYFEVGPDRITIMFTSNWVYVYSNTSCGSENVKEMVRLARLGDGLNSFIMTNVAGDYETKYKL